MGVISSLSDGIDTLQREPLIVAFVFAYSLLGVGMSAAQIVDQLLLLLAVLVFYLFVPFFIGGIIGMVHGSLRGGTSIGRFVADGKSNYLPLLGGGLLLGVITFVLYVIVAIVGFIAAIFVLGAGSMAGVTSASLIALAIGGLAGVLIVLLPWFFLQFFPAAVVVDDVGLVDSFKRSGGLVRDNFLSVLGFDGLALLIYLVAQVPTVYLFYTMYNAPGGFQQTQTIFDVFSPTELGIYLTMSVVLGTIVVSVLHAYYVAYYDQLLRGVPT